MQAALGILLDICADLKLTYRYRCDIRVNQAARDVISSYDVLADLLESIERFAYRLKVYTQLPPTPTTNEVLAKFNVELISTLAWVTRKLDKRRSRECFFTDLLPCSAQCSQIRKELFRHQGHEEGQAEARPTPTRTGRHNHDRISDSRDRPWSRRDYEEVDGR
jgi:hypothetical protein